ncbi:branched-chain amino acid aminotransferase [Desulforhopalus singaporensis]|uniref:Branched-chain-amino-acid aminotransferase n=1 Tax=Desulforhopalus singaporensis TaxID=91360 RepID=A0A1H0LCH1_9BACT|nr:branched-chain amino acid aminotransferase [Desulforhopalus singaporensis]SDO65907.1 branched chain amino acid aminotransferase apoenzyme [Desulforhopalus singaporensis]
MEIAFTKADKLKDHPEDSALGFGTCFTDYMFNMDYSPEKGWHNARIEPYGPIQMDPSTMVLHYGQSIFEGLKAYKTKSGTIQLFRPNDNLQRLNRSGRMLCMPELDQKMVLKALKELVKIEKDWIPSEPGTSLYIRPTIIATDPYVGLRSSHTYRFFIILSPVGAYYPEGFDPVKIWVTTDHVRAVRGGVGTAKTAGNYAASLFATELAHKEGYTQVLWLDGVELKYIEEVGSMNIFFMIGDELVTPELNRSILAGVTRDSVIQLAKSWGMKVVERKISIDEIYEAHDNGTLKEVFGSGTAAVISPVGMIKFKGREISIADGEVGPVAAKLFNELMAIQYGSSEDPFGWTVPVI